MTSISVVELRLFLWFLNAHRRVLQVEFHRRSSAVQTPFSDSLSNRTALFDGLRHVRFWLGLGYAPNHHDRIGESVKHLLEQRALNGHEERLVEKHVDLEALREVANDEPCHSLCRRPAGLLEGQLRNHRRSLPVNHRFEQRVDLKNLVTLVAGNQVQKCTRLGTDFDKHLGVQSPQILADVRATNF